ncbi:hypothetical protein J6590_086149 [Homalodisca vitripennis]|nr:hypothetical protein J6590_086149 [Homalodisca vitripennis]
MVRITLITSTDFTMSSWSFSIFLHLSKRRSTPLVAIMQICCTLLVAITYTIGSIFGPGLWNVSYDGLVHNKMLHDLFPVSYVKNVATNIKNRTPRVTSWMRSHRLELPVVKFKIVMFTRRRIPTVILKAVDAEQVQTRTAA